jgi:hypothetical protein
MKPFMSSETDRRSEWFVPTFGPLKFRIAVGLLFLPYTAMVLSYAVIGAMLAPVLFWDRVAAIVLIYFLGLGVAAHVLDAIGGKGEKPWGVHFSRRQLGWIAASTLLVAYLLSFHYIFSVTPHLWVIALLEGFFVFAYNLEWFNGRFHTDVWFAFSWGILPVLAGYVIQTNALSVASVLVAGAMGLISRVEIQASRPYKEMKRANSDHPHLIRFEAILKSLSGGVVLLALGLLVFRAFA